MDTELIHSFEIKKFNLFLINKLVSGLHLFDINNEYDRNAKTIIEIK